MIENLAILVASTSATILGSWCGPDGDALVIDRLGLHSSEGTDCAFDTPLAPDARILETRLKCETYNLTEDGSRRVLHTNTYQTQITLEGDDRAMIDYSDGRGAFELTRCEH